MKSNVIKKQSRTLHRKVALIAMLPLLVTTLSGIGYRLGRSWFGGTDTFGSWMMALHEGRYLGRSLVPFYVLLTGLGLIELLATGIVMFLARRRSTTQRASKQNSRWFHRVLAPIASVPILATVLTGMGYRLGRAWFGLSDTQAEILMIIHQGSWLGSTLRPFYVLFVGLCLIILLVTGFRMMGLFRRRTTASSGDR
jgi:uncharacterized iron-regulated membrane protein